MPGQVWTPERRTLHDQLTQLEPTLGALYGYMLNFMEEVCKPGDERARMVLMAHAVREMANNLPEALSDVDGVPSGRINTSEPCRALVAEWDNNSDILDVTSHALSGEERVTIPSSVLSAAARVVTSQRAATGNRRLRQSAAALRRLEPGPDPTLKMWLDALSWFESHAHLDKSRERSIPGDEAILVKLEIIETILAARLQGFFAVMDDVSALAALANAPAAPQPADPGTEGEGAQ
jgi:predicted nucleic acid-binding protein